MVMMRGADDGRRGRSVELPAAHLIVFLVFLHFRFVDDIVLVVDFLIFCSSQRLKQNECKEESLPSSSGGISSSK